MMLIAHGLAVSGQEPAFTHALALAARGGARLVSVHACVDHAQRPQPPSAATLLERWGLSHDAVPHDSVVHECCDDVADTLVDAVHALRPELFVTVTHVRASVGRLFAGSIAESVARNVRVPTLFLPAGAPGFVDVLTGSVDLSRIVVAAGTQMEAQQGVDAAVALVGLAGLEGCRLLLLHAADGHPPPDVRVPAGFAVEPHSSNEAIDAAVCALARDQDVRLVVMATHGHDGFSDVVFGSHTERVLHKLGRPLLWVPLV